MKEVTFPPMRGVPIVVACWNEATAPYDYVELITVFSVTEKGFKAATKAKSDSGGIWYFSWMAIIR